MMTNADGYIVLKGKSLTLPCLKVEFDGSSATSTVTARRKVISTSLSSLYTAEALVHSADFSNQQSFISVEDLIRPRFSDSDFKPDVALKSFKGRMLTVYGYSNSFFTSKKTHGSHLGCT